MKPPLIVIAGATACGKTGVAIALAQQINGEIVSADSMQVYKYMNIGTAKPSMAERGGIVHHMIDELNPDQPFSVAVFQTMAKKYIADIYAKGKIPILVGGTGFYINALVYDNNFMSTNNDFLYRDYLMSLAHKQGHLFVHQMLQDIDPASAHAIHANNVKRVVRALEYYKLTGETMSAHNAREKMKEQAFDTTMIVLNCSREKLYTRINQRVDAMVASGLVGEVAGLLHMGYGAELVSMQGLGYKEIVPFLEGTCTLEEAVTILKRDTRHFAKRQITWFTHQSQGLWIDVDQFESHRAIAEYILNEAMPTTIDKD